MLQRGMMPPMAEAIDAAKDYLRLDTSGDDALVAGLVTGAIERCEAVTGAVLIAREMNEILPAEAAWHWLAATPVRSIIAVALLGQDNSEVPLAAGDYEIDLDSEARGRVRLRTLPSASRFIVRYSAGSSDGWGALPIGLRHGILRLVAHWYAYREASDAPAMPAAVMALWAPMRRVRLS